jgi:hypothetical protein
VAVEILDFRAKEYRIEFDKGTTLSFTLFYLGPNNTVVDLANYRAHLTVWPYRKDTPLVFSSPSTEISITTGTAELDDGTLIADAYGVAWLFTDEATTGFDWEGARYQLTIETPAGEILPFAKGVLCLAAPGTANG